MHPTPICKFYQEGKCKRKSCFFKRPSDQRDHRHADGGHHGDTGRSRPQDRQRLEAVDIFVVSECDKKFLIMTNFSHCLISKSFQSIILLRDKQKAFVKEEVEVIERHDLMFPALSNAPGYTIQ